MTTYEPHPLCTVFPLPTSEEYAGIKESIRVNRQTHAVLLYEGKILDGRTRDRICRELGIACRYETFTGTFEEAKSRVIIENVDHRHLTVGQRALIATELATMTVGKPRSSNRVNLPDKKKSAAEAAKLLKVSEKTVKDAKALKRVSPEGAERVRRGVEGSSISGELKKAKKAAKKSGKTETETESMSRANRRNITVYKSDKEWERWLALNKKSKGGKSPSALVSDFVDELMSTPTAGSSAKEVRERDRRLNPITPLGGLTDEEYDPDFKGTSLNLAREAGLVKLRTKREIEQEKFDLLLEELLANVERIPLDAITIQYLQGWIDGGKPPKFRQEQLAKRWEKFEALHERLAALVAQMESAKTDKLVEA